MHICTASLCLSNAQKNVIFQSSKGMYLLPHPFGKAGDPTPPPKGLPRGQRFSSSHIAVHLFKKPAAPPLAAGFFVFSVFPLSSGNISVESHHADGRHGMGACTSGKGIGEALLHGILRHGLGDHAGADAEIDDDFGVCRHEDHHHAMIL